MAIFSGACTTPPVEESPVDLLEQRARFRKENDSLIGEAKKIIRSGDLLLRTGTDFSSEQVKNFNKNDKTYSHGGIAVVENDSVFVYHVEPDFHYLTDKVRKEPVDSFFNPDKNEGFGIARYDLTEAEKKGFLAYLDSQYRKKIPFDIRFDLSTNDSMYCSEMIRKGLAQSTHNRILIPTDRITDKRKFKIIRQYFKLDNKAIASRDLIFIDHLFMVPGCSVIQRTIFRQ
jgi:hypothetical protein